MADGTYVPDSLDDLPNGNLPVARVTGALKASNNLSDVASASAALANLGINSGSFLTPTGNGSGLTGITASQVSGLGTAATQSSSAFDAAGAAAAVSSTLTTSIATKLTASNNLSDLASAATARTNLGLGSAATQSSSAFDAAGAAAAVSSTLTTSIATKLTASSNLSDLASAATARANLGLGGAATLSVGTTSGTVVDGGVFSAAIGAVARGNGWSLVNTVTANLSQASARTPNTIYNSCRGGNFVHINDMSTQSVSSVKLVCANYFGNAQPNGMMPALNDIFVKGSLYNPTTTEQVPVFFGGDRRARISSREIKVSDPVQFATSSGTQFDLLLWVAVENGLNTVPSVLTVGGGTTGPQPNSTDGVSGTDFTDYQPSTAVHNNTITTYSYQAVLGFTGSTSVKSIAAIGDSIGAGTGDIGVPFIGVGGYLTRIALQVPNVLCTWPQYNTGAFGFVNVCRAGDTLAHFLGVAASRCQLQLASYATTVISEFGINDVSAGTTLGTLKSNLLTLAGIIARQNQKFIQCTLLPKTASTNGWVDLANQSIPNSAQEIVRTGLNSWLRDNTSAGFVQSAASATGFPASTFAVFDAAAAVEVNSSGANGSPNGGYWNAPAGSSVLSSTVTAGATGQFTDSTLSAKTLNQYQGYAVRWKTGANANFACTITGHTPTLVNLSANSLAAIATGDTYEIWQDIPTVDGTHPTAWSHNKIAKTFTTSLIG